MTGKLTKKLVDSLGPGRHGDGGGLYLVVKPSGTRSWIVRVVVRGQRNAKGARLRTDIGLGGAGKTDNTCLMNSLSTIPEHICFK